MTGAIKVLLQWTINGVTKQRMLEEPPPGKTWMFVPIDRGLQERIAKLDAGGYWEDELSGAVERAIVDFYMTRPVEAISTPRSLERSFKLYDHRDKTKGKG